MVKKVFLKVFGWLRKGANSLDLVVIKDEEDLYYQIQLLIAKSSRHITYPDLEPPLKETYFVVPPSLITQFALSETLTPFQKREKKNVLEFYMRCKKMEEYCGL